MPAGNPFNDAVTGVEDRDCSSVPVRGSGPLGPASCAVVTGLRLCVLRSEFRPTVFLRRGSTVGQKRPVRLLIMRDTFAIQTKITCQAQLL